jgi:hypothetical protein
MEGPTRFPIACSLNEAELRERRQTIMKSFSSMEVRGTELPAGYAYSVPATSEVLTQVTQLVDMERLCCPFLTFTIIIEPAGKGIRLEITGPKEAKALITQYFDFDRR